MEMVNNSIEIEVHSTDPSTKNKEHVQASQQPDQEQSDEPSTNQEQGCNSAKQSNRAEPSNKQEQEQNSAKQPNLAEPRGFSRKVTTLGRAGIFAIVIGLLLMGRFSVPDNAVACIQDKIQEGLQAANDFINNPENDYARRIMQALCSFCIDVVFIGTFIYWIFRGNSWRLPLTLGVFYLVRIIVQKFWFMPFPPGFMWSDPGVPSLVVPYGRGSDFYYSGHTGFVTICAKEWHKIGNRTIRNLIILVGAYTIMILLIYRIHYSIDVFTGLFFADWCFITADANKELYDPLWLKISLWAYDILNKVVKRKQLPKK